MKAALIDHDDSFTSNLRHWLKPLFTQIDVYNHRDFFSPSSNSKLADDYELIVLSPGPKHPSDYPQTLEWLKTSNIRMPVLGVCLGLQMLVLSAGGSVEAYSPPLHGKKSKLKVEKELVELANAEVARYHSLICNLKNIPDEFQLLAESNDDQQPMWLRHKIKKWMGMQFHPESFLTEKSETHLKYLQLWLKS